MKKWKWIKPFSILRMVLSLLTVGQGIPVSAMAASSPVSVRVIASSNGNPKAVTSLEAATDFSEPLNAGKITLRWVAPSSSDGSSVFSYVIKYATFPVSNLQGNTTNWWNHSLTSTVTEPEFPSDWGYHATKSPGNDETLTLTNLVSGTYYYFGIRAYDRYHRLSDYDDNLKGITTQAGAFATTLPLTPAKITNLSALTGTQSGTINLSWTLPQFIDIQSSFVNGRIDSPGEYCIQYATTIPPSVVAKPNSGNNWEQSNRVFVSTYNIATGTMQSYLVTGLTIDTTYYFHVFTRNEWPNRWSTQTNNYAYAHPYVNMLPVNDLEVSVYGSTDTQKGTYVSLMWTNPTNEHISGVRVCYSNGGYPDLEGPTVLTDLVTNEPGQSITFNHYQLLPRTTYYYSVYAYDNFGNYASGVNVSTFTFADSLSPDGVRNLTAIAYATLNLTDPVLFVKLQWTTPLSEPADRNGDYNGLKIYYSTYTDNTDCHQLLATVTGLNNQVQEYIHSDLNTYTTYYYSIRSYDVEGNASDSVPISICLDDAKLPPDTPVNVIASVSAFTDPSKGCTMNLSWTSPSNVNFKGVKIVYRSDRQPQDINDGTLMLDWTGENDTTSSHTFEQLVPKTTYYVSIFAYSYYGLYSKPYSFSQYMSIPWVDDVSPFSPMGVHIIKQPSLQIQWRAVQFNSNQKKFSNTQHPRLDELYGYEIYRSSFISNRTWELQQRLAGQTTTYLINNDEGKHYFYKVRGFDVSDNYSDSYIIDTDNNLIALNDDGSYLYLSAELAGVVSREGNAYKKDIILSLDRNLDEEKGPIIRSLSWKAYQVVESSSIYTLQLINNFNVASAEHETSQSGELAISYATISSQSTAKLSGTNDSDIGKSLSIFYHNGVEWLKLGSKLDAEQKVIKSNVKYAGKYQLRKSAPESEFTFYGIIPKIITPNNDGQNDRVFFRYANPKASVISLKVFDIQGALVKKISDSNKTSDNQGNYIYWDAKDKDNMTVKPGVYIYQLEGEGKVINGTIVVAR